jgi:photosystem II stability/assembly factor-like uncharacterized protein
MTGMTEQAEHQDVIHALAGSPDLHISLSARSSGLYRSEDGGLTWHGAYGSLNLQTPLPTAAVALSPGFASDRTVFAGVPGGILRSADGGHTWTAVQLRSPPPFVYSLVVSPDYAQDGVVLAGTMEDGVFRSGDRGAHWAAWNFGLLDLSVLCLSMSPAYADDETVFAGTDSGIFRSMNGGRAWRETNFPADWAPVLSLALSPGYGADGMLFAGTESAGLFRSNDQGRTWNRLGEEVIAGPVNSVVLAPDFPAQPAILALLGNALLVSRDGGRSWSDWKPGLPVDRGLTAVAAPQGLGPGAPLLVGLADGAVLRI